MARTSSLVLSRHRLQEHFASAEGKVYAYAQLKDVLHRHREEWGLAARITTPALINFLEPLGLKKIQLRGKDVPDLVRYAWPGASVLHLALSIERDAYMSHAGAVMLHGLSDVVIRMLYVNREQPAKPPSRSRLAQSAIDRAFAAKRHRRSNRIYDLTSFGPYSATVLSGKQTSDLGVELLDGPAGEKVRATNLERTLIDIVVRPGYAGGIYQVLAAYEAARERVSVRRLLATLRRLKYVYPYHQAIGFLMSRTGYADRQLAPLRRLPKEFDFYLDYNLKKTTAEYSDDWRLYYPGRM